MPVSDSVTDVAQAQAVPAVGKPSRDGDSDASWRLSASSCEGLSSPAGTMTLFSSVALLGGVAAWGLTRGSVYEEVWYCIVAPSLLMCLERLVTLQSTGDSRLRQKEKRGFSQHLRSNLSLLNVSGNVPITLHSQIMKREKSVPIAWMQFQPATFPLSFR